MKISKNLGSIVIVSLIIGFSLEAQKNAGEEIKTTSPSKTEEVTTPSSNSKEKNPNNSAEVENPITLSQFYWNDVPFRGFSVLGSRLAQRDNESYKSMPQAWNLVTGVSYNPSENFSIGMNAYNPTAHRANRDNDYFMQSGPGDKTDFTGKFVDSVMANNPNIIINEALKKAKDPSSLRMRNEKNGLKDIFDASFTYKYNTRFGKIVTGFYFANNDNYNLHLGELVAGLEFPFWKALNPAYTGYYRFTSENGGGGNGTSNHRLSISHKFFSESDINITTSLAAGYQYHSNLTEYHSGVSDISPKIQVNYKSYYISFMDMIRPDSSLWDSPGGSGAYQDFNRNDGRVDDPSKIHGARNQYVVDQIALATDRFRSSDSTGGFATDLAKMSLTQRYQQQKFVHHIYYFTMGYSMKF